MGEDLLTHTDAKQMFVRKLVAAYFSSWTVILWLSFPDIVFGKTSWNAAESYMSSVQVIALYVVPVIFLYGILVSSLLETATKKIMVKVPGVMFVSSLLHVVFGLCIGFVFQISQIIIMGGVAAFLFFCFDLIIVRYTPSLKLKTRVIFFAAPILLLVLIEGTLYAITPPKPPFTANDAVQFATSGNGTSIDRFPKEEGQVKLQIVGYDVERETKVEEMSRKAVYIVVFTERWRKGTENGQYQMVYEVRREGMELKRSTGLQPPYLEGTIVQ